VKNQKNEKIELSKNQESPRCASPADFEVIEAHDPNYLGDLPFHGQCGTSLREYKQLLAVREAGRSKKGRTNYEVAVQREKARESYPPKVAK
jgi:hypothetical protein